MPYDSDHFCQLFATWEPPTCPTCLLVANEQTFSQTLEKYVTEMINHACSTKKCLCSIYIDNTRRKYMAQTTMSGIIAGATGTVALDVATYLDMAIRGRSSSSAPSQLIDVTA